MPSTYEQKLRWKKKHRDLYLAGKSRNNKHRAQHTRQWLSDFKKTLVCACGETDPACLDFHHRDPTQKQRRMRDWTKYSLAKIKEEIKKCEPMCSNCHRKGHAGRPHPEHAQFFPTKICPGLREGPGSSGLPTNQTTTETMIRHSGLPLECGCGDRI